MYDVNRMKDRMRAFLVRRTSLSIGGPAMNRSPRMFM